MNDLQSNSHSRSAAILIWSSNLWNFADGLLGPLFAVFAQQIGGNVLDIAWAWGAYLVVTGVCIIVVGHLSDKISKLKMLLAGYFLTAVFTFAYLFVHNALQLLLVQAALGVALALTNPTFFSLMGKLNAGEREGAMWGWADGRDKIATGLAVFAGGLIVQQASFHVLFIIMGTLQLVATVYLARLLRDGGIE